LRRSLARLFSDHCYAREFAERFRGVPGHPYEQGFDVRLWPERVDLPRTWKKPAMIFVNSMSDVFHSAIPIPLVDRAWAMMEACPQHVFQILTKRPKLMARYMLAREARGERVLPNVWLGTSIESREHVGRADQLRRAPAAVRFISAEPLLGPLVSDRLPVGLQRDPYVPLGQPWRDAYDGPELDLTSINWLICGGESGPGARPMDEAWARSLKDACAATGTAWFMKQMGTVYARQHGGKGKGEDPLLIPEDLRVREFPARIAALELPEGPERAARLF
jgi:protein gp37